MSAKNTAFRSKNEREKEVDLLKKYREIGIAAIAAASGVRRRVEAAAPRPAANLNYAD